MATDPPTDPFYAIRYGIPAENVEKIDFAIEGILKPERNFIIRRAPAVGKNPGGGIEVVTNKHSVESTNRQIEFSKNQFIGNRSQTSQCLDRIVKALASEPLVGALENQNQVVTNKKRP